MAALNDAAREQQHANTQQDVEVEAVDRGVVETERIVDLLNDTIRQQCKMDAQKLQRPKGLDDESSACDSESSACDSANEEDQPRRMAVRQRSMAPVDAVAVVGQQAMGLPDAYLKNLAEQDVLFPRSMVLLHDLEELKDELR